MSGRADRQLFAARARSGGTLPAIIALAYHGKVSAGASWEFQSWTMPWGGGRCSLMASSHGNIAMACSGVNQIALVEVA